MVLSQDLVASRGLAAGLCSRCGKAEGCAQFSNGVRLEWPWLRSCTTRPGFGATTPRSRGESCSVLRGRVEVACKSLPWHRSVAACRHCRRAQSLHGLMLRSVLFGSPMRA
mmetsp:Transcript_144185/g.461685  ORF Transcript_144185/g.461685 Transcript_144185/m.461685 type:complete len:111 (-) Transcript_144185:7-339(-)